ncbi:glycosyl transferase family 1 [Pseudomonas synxantha]|uniref:Glycosyl transferase family 1 n=1 Tax=Pseudomonas libanensis TaxID=75588 RepID=A0ABR5MA91_9PSED|nr:MULTISPECIES: glycosyltransferase family 4 protein [Pseudomonas]AMS21022.1 glycosyl transferase family 1 [Pseudomonas synxantha]KPG75935.1 glycosyl transferase family 1 [Pseudomonas libanensis]KRA18280.1 glycosyl transferase family 1 [Pseudomonas sp. Root569]
MKILLLPKYSRMGASTRLRTLQFLPFLEAEGSQVDIQTLFDDKYLENLYRGNGRSFVLTFKQYILRFALLFKAARYDVVWIEKEIFPFCPAFAERLLKLFGIPYIVDYDDAVFHTYDLSSNALVRVLLGSKIDTVMRHAGCVVAGNAYLAERAIKAGAANVEVIPTVVDHSRYASTLTPPNKKLVIGWIGSPSTEKYVVQIRDALRLACETYGARVVLMGASEGVINELEGIDVEVQAWSEYAETGFVQALDIGIMPLIDGLWEKGKCGYKLIQYMACGVPVIASPVGVNVDIVESNQCGMLATDMSDWHRCLHTLLGDRDLRLFYGSKGRHAVENVFSVQVQAPRIRDILAVAASRAG